MLDPRPDSPPGTPTAGGARPRSTGAEISWPRAVLLGVGIVVVGFVGAVVLPNAIVVQLDGLTTFTRSILATSLTVVVVVTLAWGLRRLQARRRI